MTAPLSYKHYLELLKKHRGLGDTVADIFHATGLDRLSDAYTVVTGKPCNCSKRQDKLNKMFPYEKAIDSR